MNNITIKFFFFFFNRPIFSNVIYSSDCKAEFSASLLQSSVSHDPLEIIQICWFNAQGTLLIINVKKTNFSGFFNDHSRMYHKRCIASKSSWTIFFLPGLWIRTLWLFLSTCDGFFVHKSWVMVPCNVFSGPGASCFRLLCLWDDSTGSVSLSSSSNHTSTLFESVSSPCCTLTTSVIKFHA